LAKIRRPRRALSLGAYPIKHHLECPEKTRKSVSGPEELKLAPTAGLQARLDAGLVFEADRVAEMLSSFEGAGWRRIEVDCDGTAATDAAIDKLSRSRIGARLTVVNIVMERTDVSKAQAEKASLAACRAGAHVIFGARFVADGRTGQPDLLVREEWTKSGVRRYLGGDFKDHRANKGTTRPRPWLVSEMAAPAYELAAEQHMAGTPQLNDSLQLVHYWYLLDSFGFAGARVGGIIGRELTMVWRDLDDRIYDRGRASAFEVYDAAFTGTVDAIHHEQSRLLNPALAPLSFPEMKTACGECEWREVCHEEMVAADSITLLPGVTPTRAQSHYEVGVTTIAELAHLDVRTAQLVEAGVDTATLVAASAGHPADAGIGQFARARDVGSLMAAGVNCAADAQALCAHTALYSTVKATGLVAAIDQARVQSLQRVHRARGVDFVAIDRAAVELDIDIEDDSGGICYLIGVKETLRSRGEVKTRYLPFVTWEHTPEAEARVFAEFFGYVFDLIERAKKNKMGAVRAFHYTDHESRFFLHLAEKHAGVPGVPTVEAVQEFLDSEVWVDMHPILAKQLVWPTENLTLKSLAKYVKFFWRDDEPGGANSVAWYHEAIGDGDAAEAARTRVLEYNEDDVEATAVLRDWVSRFGAARRPGQKLPNVADLDGRFRVRRSRRFTVNAV
jgi:predicted RecB family nuclease